MLTSVHNERGMTIIESTVILSVLFILAGAMSPVVSESVTMARAVRAKNDASMIAMALVNLEKDLGGDAVAFSSVASSQALHLPDVLATAGEAPELDDNTDETQTLFTSLFSGRRGNGGGDSAPDRALHFQQRRRWRESRTESVDDHLTNNHRGYRYRRPGEYGGWNGPYLSAPIKGDPWGKQYMVNTAFLDGGSTIADAQGQPRRAVFVVSAGANGVIETPFDQPMTEAQPVGDDIAIRIQ